MLIPVLWLSHIFHLTIRYRPSFVCYLCKESQSIGLKKVFDKTIAAQIHGSNFVIFNFLINDGFFLEPCRIFGFF